MEKVKKRDRLSSIINKVIFFTTRVHPGETPGSFVLNGIIDLLLNKTKEQSRRLLDNFVFKIIPWLNPDGWSRGYFRLDTKNQNLNRYYTEPTLEKQPTIYVTKKAIVQQSEYGVLKYYIDLHAHASKIGWFLFGNALKGDELLSNFMLAKLISMNSLNFDYSECCFSAKNMKVKDKGNGLSREGWGRVAIYRATEVPHWYTLECNYASGKRLSHLPAKYNKEKKCIEPESYLTDPKSRLYWNKPPVFNMEIFEDIGRATVISMLDLANDNPISRIPKSIYKDVRNMKLEMSIQNNINVAAAKKQKEELLRKRLQEEERKKRNTNIRKPVKRPVMTPGAAERFQKLHRGQSWTSVLNPQEKESKPENKELPKIQSTSFDKHKESANRKKRNGKKKLNIKQSILAEHFSKKNRAMSSNTEKTTQDDSVPKSTKYNPISGIKGSIQTSSRSYFRIGKNIEKNYFKSGKQHSFIAKGEVKGEEQYLKSRSKPVRPSVKVWEIRPVGLYGIGIASIGSDFTNLNNTTQDILDSSENPIRINSYNVNENYDSKKIGLIII